MLEIVVLILTVPWFAVRARQRGLRGGLYLTLAIVGVVVLFFWGPVIVVLLGLHAWIPPAIGSMALRWAWLGVLFLYLELLANRRRTAGESWMCPDCRLFNDPKTVVCSCGHEYAG